jgi:diguanylate cyclase (GGDEF)-like protein/PAS domain S-box-containing protein
MSGIGGKLAVGAMLRTSDGIEVDADQLLLLVENAGDPILILDTERRFRFCNPAFSRIFGYGPREVEGRSIRLLHLSEMSFRKFGTIAYPFVAENGLWRGEWDYRTRAGTVVTMDTTITPQKDRQGELCGYLVMMRDATKRKNVEQELRVSEIRFREIYEHMSSGVAIFRAEEEGPDFVVCDLNRAAIQIEQLQDRKVEGERLLDLFPGIAECGLWDVIREVWRTGEPRHHPECYYRDHRIEGWRQNYVFKLPSEEIVAVYDDVTERRKAEEAIRESENRLQNILESIHSGIVIIDAADHRIKDVNSRALRLIGGSREDILERDCRGLICGCRQGQCPVTDRGRDMENADWDLLTLDGERVPVLKTVTRLEIRGREHLVESFLDVSRMKRMQDHLRKLATRDSLTGISNRGHFMELAGRELKRALRYGGELCLIVFDIDDFKAVNDRYGHDTGDKVIREVAAVTGNVLRSTDVLGRIGGEEFAVAVPECGVVQARAVAERLRATVQGHTFHASKSGFSVTLSVGVAQLASGQEDLQSLLKRADQALYRAKNRGKNGVASA